VAIVSGQQRKENSNFSVQSVGPITRRALSCPVLVGSDAQHCYLLSFNLRQIRKDNAYITENPVTVQVVMLGFFQTGVFSTSVASQQSLAVISSLLAAMSFFCH